MKMTSRRFVLMLTLVLAVALAHAGERKLSPLTPGVNGVVGPQVIAETKVAPVHPETAADKAATLTLAAVVRQDGTVAEVKILGCDVVGAGFEKAAEEAVRQWRFLPGTWNGRAVDTVQKMRMRIGPAGDAAATANSAGAAGMVVPVVGGPGLSALLGRMMVQPAGTMRSEAPIGNRPPPVIGGAVKPEPIPRSSCAPGAKDCLYAKPQIGSSAVAPLPSPTGR